MYLKLYFTHQEKYEYLIKKGYSLIQQDGKIQVHLNGLKLYFHWNKLDFTKYDQVNEVFTSLIKSKLLEL